MYSLTFWALTIGCILGGLMASRTWFGNKLPFLNTFLNKLAPFQTIIGIVCLAGGVLAFFYPRGPESFTGDLIPAVIAIVLGFTLWVSMMPSQPPLLGKINNMIKPYHVPLGILAIIAAVLHWSFMGDKAFF